MSASSRKPVTCWMKVDESSGVFISASCAALAGVHQRAGDLRFLVTTTQARSWSQSFFSTSRCVASSQGAQVGDLGVAEDLHPLGVEVLGEARQREARLLDARAE